MLVPLTCRTEIVMARPVCNSKCSGTAPSALDDSLDSFDGVAELPPGGTLIVRKFMTLDGSSYPRVISTRSRRYSGYP